MLSADHLNIDGPPFPVKCVRKVRSALGGEVAYRGVCVRVRARTYLHDVPRVDIVHVLYISTADF